MTDSEGYPYDPEPTITTPIRPYQERAERRRATEDLEERFRRRTLWQLILAGILFFGLIYVAYRQQTADDPDPALVAAVDELRTQVRGLGATPAVPAPEDIVDNPPEVVAVPGPEGPRGVQGEPGRDGRDGAPCLATNPFCVGPEGPGGAAGEPGATGEPGAPGESIVGPEGPQGETGATGPAGADGRGITSVQVVEQAPNDCHLIVTYTDGTTQDAGAVDCPTPPVVPMP